MEKNEKDYEKKMIVIKVMGGLGNQLFQLAFGMSIAKKYNYKVKYDITYYDNIPENDTKRELCIKKYLNWGNIATKEEIESYQFYHENKIYRVLRKLHIKREKVQYERLENGISDLSQVSDDRYLIGFWQSERYISTVRDEIVEMLQNVPATLDNQVKEIIHKVQTCESVSIHVRAGDYLAQENEKVFGGICTSEYYKRCYALAKQAKPQAKFYLFTNDVEWTKEHIDLPYSNIEIVSYIIKNDDPWGELMIMSRCHTNIIANSSYSWWAAWLNTNSDQTVYCPTKWTNNDSKLNEGILCSSWIRV